jgi:hypothetical protein
VQWGHHSMSGGAHLGGSSYARCLGGAWPLARGVRRRTHPRFEIKLAAPAHILGERVQDGYRVPDGFDPGAARQAIPHLFPGRRPLAGDAGQDGVEVNDAPALTLQGPHPLDDDLMLLPVRAVEAAVDPRREAVEALGGGLRMHVVPEGQGAEPLLVPALQGANVGLLEQATQRNEAGMVGLI